jgi:Rieske Fe-S protein
LTPDVFQTPEWPHTQAAIPPNFPRFTHFAIGRERACPTPYPYLQIWNTERNHWMQGNATTSPAPDAGRRTLVSWLLGGGVAASLASFFYPVARFLDPPKVAEVSVNEVAAGKVQDLKPNSGKIVKFGNKPALLVRINDTEWKAFSAVCTHLNCTVQYQESRREIWCACHNGTYDLEGRVASGPPPKPLEELAVKVRGDDVVISKRV